MNNNTVIVRRVYRSRAYKTQESSGIDPKQNEKLFTSIDRKIHFVRVPLVYYSTGWISTYVGRKIDVRGEENFGSGAKRLAITR